MMGALYIGWRYVVFHRIKIVLLIGCLTLVLALPVALRISQLRRVMWSRSRIL